MSSVVAARGDSAAALQRPLLAGPSPGARSTPPFGDRSDGRFVVGMDRANTPPQYDERRPSGDRVGVNVRNPNQLAMMVEYALAFA